jgi:PHD/YefM family antitoxin component YafN of YafNO toxin-antitoxin module
MRGTMMHRPRFLVDDEGHKVGVLLDIDTYQQLLEELEELESLRAFDRAKEEAGEAIPLDEALAEIERTR